MSTVSVQKIVRVSVRGVVMYEKLEKLMESRNVSRYKLSKDLGFSRSMFTDWKAGKYTPKQDKIQMIAEYFGVPLSYFYGEEPEPSYYIDEEVAQIAQELHDDPDLRLMFMAARDMPKEDIIAFRQLMKKWRGEDND